MKKIIPLFLLILFHFSSSADTIIITVANFQFSPSAVNATVGDVIKFEWSSGNHTTTCGNSLDGTSLPPGADEWDSPINSASPAFTYTLVVEGTYTYGCIFHSFAGAGMIGTINVSAAVPVTFGDFTATAANRRASLNWTTLTEENTSHFSVKKSTDGIHFTKVADIPAAGYSNSLKTYSYSDDISRDRYRFLFYEIATVDLDNKQSLSSIKTVRSDLDNNDLIVNIGSNPIVRPQLMKVFFNADGRGSMAVKIYSMSGKLVLKDKMETFYGLNDSHLHVCDLPAGEYVVMFDLNGKKESRKIVIK